MRVLVEALEGINLAEEGVDGGDDPAVFGLEDLRQIALAAEDRRLPAICSFPPSLAFLGLVMLKLHVNSVIGSSILEAVDCVVVQSGVGIGEQQTGRGSAGIGGRCALAVAIQNNQLVRGLGNLHVVLQDVAHGNSGGVAVDRRVHVELAPSAMAPLVARAAECVSGTGDADAHLGGEQNTGGHNGLVGDERLGEEVASRNRGIVALDVLAILDKARGQRVVEDLSSFAALDVLDGFPASGKTSKQAKLIGAVQDVDVPAGAGVAFLGGVEVQGGEHQLQPLHAGQSALGSVGGLGHAVSQTSDAAVVDEGQGPGVVAVNERVLCVGVQGGDSILTLDLAVGSRVVDDRHDLGCLSTGEVAIRLEVVRLTILETIKNVEVGQNVNCFGVIAVSLDIRVVLCAGDGDGAHDHDNGQNQRENLFQILHLDFLLFKFYTSEQSPLCNLYLHLTAPPPFRQAFRGVCNLTVTLRVT